VSRRADSTGVEACGGAPDPVGRGTRRAEDVIALSSWPAPVLSRSVRPASSIWVCKSWHRFYHAGSQDIIWAAISTARLKTGAVRFNRLATSPARRVLRPTGQGPLNPTGRTQALWALKTAFRLTERLGSTRMPGSIFRLSEMMFRIRPR
jgi:hypothetical protein